MRAIASHCMYMMIFSCIGIRYLLVLRIIPRRSIGELVNHIDIDLALLPVTSEAITIC